MTFTSSVIYGKVATGKLVLLVGHASGDGFNDVHVTDGMGVGASLVVDFSITGSDNIGLASRQSRCTSLGIAKLTPILGDPQCADDLLFGRGYVQQPLLESGSL
ncbi:MAG: hypothetical protein ACYSW3_00255 [Planctomycetota bacterium]